MEDEYEPSIHTYTKCLVRRKCYNTDATVKNGASRNFFKCKWEDFSIRRVICHPLTCFHFTVVCTGMNPFTLWCWFFCMFFQVINISHSWKIFLEHFYWWFPYFLSTVLVDSCYRNVGPYAHDLLIFCALHLHSLSLLFPSSPLSCPHPFLNSSLPISLPLSTGDTLKFYLQASIR